MYYMEREDSLDNTLGGDERDWRSEAQKLIRLEGRNPPVAWLTYLLPPSELVSISPLNSHPVKLEYLVKIIVHTTIEEDVITKSF